MPAFIIATITITDSDRFQQYSRSIAGLSERFGGTYVVKGIVSEMLEGRESPGERVVVSCFPDADAARSYIHSPEYQAAQTLRENAATVEMRLVEA